MSSFLKAFGGSLTIKKIVGICPFVITKKRVHTTTGSTTYAILYLSVNIVLYTIFANLVNDNYTKIKNLSFTALLLYHLDAVTVGVANMLMLFFSISHRQTHVELLNQIERLHNHMRYTGPGKNGPNYSKLHIYNACFTVVCFGFSISNLFVFKELDNTLQSNVFFFIFTCASLNIMSFMLHAQDIVIVLMRSIDNCFSIQDGMMDISTENMHLISDLYTALEYFNQCYGVHILLNIMHDILILANLMFYVIEQYAFVKFKMTFIEWYELGANAAPVFVKNVILFSVMDRINAMVIATILAH